MIIVPAIDIREGRIARLRKGNAEPEEVYGGGPVEVARRWEDEGAQRLHVVDLDAVIVHRPQYDVVSAIIDAVAIPVEVGGGLRVLENAMRYRDRGANRIIFGSASVAAPGVVQEAVRLWPDAVVVAFDARAGEVFVVDADEITTVSALQIGAQVKAWGVPRIQYTDVRWAGTPLGPNLTSVEEIARALGGPITVAGGIRSLDDIRSLAAFSSLGIDEVVVGRALNERRFSLEEATRAGNHAAAR